MKEMFCFQCQQTAHNTGCEGRIGVCGKKADTANMQDALIGALIGLARAAKAGTRTEKTDVLMLKGLFTTITNVNFDNGTIEALRKSIAGGSTITNCVTSGKRTRISVRSNR